ncbi:MAG: hypothetical protein A3G24_00710 [Betaproteobacteria bacterium RIFCSPLOWO2_12_FULL_62_13]|nr:MAG: hypothetical protein A3G24_00710 [Betaproteobacteria bacterium RIFCSPLOWO2_12_FULL_62_13]
MKIGLATMRAGRFSACAERGGARASFRAAAGRSAAAEQVLAAIKASCTEDGNKLHRLGLLSGRIGKKC